jgi:hypothetical protein
MSSVADKNEMHPNDVEMHEDAHDVVAIDKDVERRYVMTKQLRSALLGHR